MKRIISISIFLIVMITLFNCKKTDQQINQQPSLVAAGHYDEMAAKNLWLKIRQDNNKMIPDYLKQTAPFQARSAGFSYTGTTNLQPDTSYGISSTVTIPNWSAGGAIMKSFWNAGYFVQYYDPLLGRIRQLWIQWGYGVHEDYGDIPILAVYDLFGGGEITDLPYRLVNDGTVLKAGDVVKFSFNLIPGTNILQLGRNDVVIWEFTFPEGAKIGFNRAEFMVEAWASRPPNIATVEASPALLKMDFNNNWNDVKYAHVSQIQGNTHIQAEHQGYPKYNGFLIGSKVKAAPGYKEAVINDTLWYINKN